MVGTILYKQWVVDGVINRPVSDIQKIFRQAYFNGCMGFTDATHVGVLSCPY